MDKHESSSPDDIQHSVDPVGGAIIAGGFIFLLGLFIALVAFIPSNIDYRLIKHGDTVDGIVTEVRERSPRGKTYEEATISYTVDGKDYIIKEKQRKAIISGFTPTEKGSTVTVYYNSEDPSKAVAKGWEKNAVFGYIAGGIGCAIGLFVVSSTIIKSKKDEKKTG